MSKAATIDALMESAIRCFSQYGYEGASLRDIAASAGVPLSTIHMYFGSKSELYAAILRKAWDEIDDERSLLLSQALARAGDGPVDVAEFIHALAAPVVRRMLEGSPHDQARIFVIRGRVGGESLSSDRGGLLKVADRSMARWIDALQRATMLSRQDTVWAFSFVVGSLYSWQLVDHRYDQLMGEDVARTAEGVTGDIVAFGCAGIQALIERRRQEALVPAQA